MIDVYLISLQVAPKIFGGDIKTHFLVFFPQSDLESYTTDLTTVAKEMKGKVCINYVVDSSCKLH